MKKTKYLFEYNYGMGGVFCYFYAESENMVLKKYPELCLVKEVPKWFIGELKERVEEHLTFDIDDPITSEFLLAIEKGRGK